VAGSGNEPFHEIGLRVEALYLVGVLSASRRQKSR
jgi:hypothetical protein